MEDSEAFRDALRAWYRHHRRDLPWRRTRDPYAILVSEVLLQQTRIEAGVDYYHRFLTRFPTAEALARASEEEVLRAWEGLGYYRRARLLHRAAREIVDRHGGRVPSDAETLASLPGVGPYTAGAVASIAFGQPVPAVDGNVVRVLSRLFCLEGDVTRAATKRSLQNHARALMPENDPGTYNQALMELGALVCLPKGPRCGRCPVLKWCEARARGVEATLPRRKAPREVPELPAAFAIVKWDGRVLLVRRARDGLLGGLWSLPGGELRPGEKARPTLRRRVREAAGLEVQPGAEVGSHVHTFSHKRWDAVAIRCDLEEPGPLLSDARWASLEELTNLPMVPFHRVLLRKAGAAADPHSREAVP